MKKLFKVFPELQEPLRSLLYVLRNSVILFAILATESYKTNCDKQTAYTSLDNSPISFNLQTCLTPKLPVSINYKLI